jgi:hypothetical protein
MEKPKELIEIEASLRRAAESVRRQEPDALAGRIESVPQMLNSARAFSLAAERCLEARPLGREKFEMLPIPAITCIAFAIELRLKAIGVLDGGTYEFTHDLWKIYSKLPISTQQEFPLKLSMPAEQLELQLKSCSNSFVVWRYVFDYHSAAADLDFLRRLSDASLLIAEEKAASKKTKA